LVSEVLQDVNAGILYRAIQAFFEKESLDFRAHRKIGWAIHTNYQDDDECADRCVDRSPNKTWSKHRI
jgi:hypothetical protein